MTDLELKKAEHSGGVYGTAFWIDPTEQLIAVLMLLAPERRLYYRHLLRPLVYGAITGPP